MKCPKCKLKNDRHANYCEKCRYIFSKKEKRKANFFSVFGLLEKIEKGYKVLSLDIIFGNIIFKIISLLFVLSFGIYNVYSNGNQMRIEDSDYYTYEFNEKEEEYYLYVKEDEVPLSLYLPKKVDQIKITYYDKKSQKLEEKEYAIDDLMIVKANTIANNYYEIIAETVKIKIYVYKK